MATKAEHLKDIRASNPSLTEMIDGVSSTMSASDYEATINQWAIARAATDVRNEIIAHGGASADYASFRTDSMIDGSYPRISDQLDMLFHDITDGKLDETGSWYTAIKATKDKFTKP